MITWLKLKLGLGLTFKQAWAYALKHSDRGRSIRRDAWAPNAQIVCFYACGPKSLVLLQYGNDPNGYTRKRYWQPYALDFTATDWRVL